jgi:ubiquinol oxidase
VTSSDAQPITRPPHLDHEALAHAQTETLNTPRRPYGLPARVLFGLLDVLYRRKRTLSKFKVLELVARVPYQSWEQVAYIAITHVALRPGLARRIHDRVAQARVQQDNEQWHLLILEELVASTGKKESRWRSSTTRCHGCCTCSTRPGPTSSTPTSKIMPSMST